MAFELAFPSFAGLDLYVFAFQSVVFFWIPRPEGRGNGFLKISNFIFRFPALKGGGIDALKSEFSKISCQISDPTSNINDPTSSN
jgi:hypothetical protein